MKYYALINPFTNKVEQFTTFVDEDFTVTNIISNTGAAPTVESSKAICLEISELDYSLLEKVYNPATGQFV